MEETLTHNAEHICKQLELDIKDILNIYPYGSRVYGSYDEYSDNDYIIVYKSSLLPSGAFKDNAISSYDRKIQGVCYSRGGFQDALNNYQMSALECLYLNEDDIIQKKWNFKLSDINMKVFAKKVITTASSSWHNSKLAYKDDNVDGVARNIYHAFRILDFGLQIKEHGKIINYSSTNDLKKELLSQDEVKPKDWHDKFINMCEKLKQ